MEMHGFKVWFDKYAIRPGQDIVERIEAGLAECRHAILIITQRFLRNKSWASHELNALIARQFAEKRKDLIIPVLIGVRQEEFSKRSPLLRPIRSVSVSAMKFRTQVVGAVREISRTVRPDGGDSEK
jgi:TIR domain